jgi:asparagine synthase (glutamine-hydrolysing)
VCGITGFLDSELKLNRQDLLSMTDCLKHRGPDAQGIYYNEPHRVGLGHRRLSIIDPTDSSNQPFTSSSGRYTIVYNGEVYNYKELAGSANVALKTSGDTEVIVELFEQYGPAFVNKLNGMFAFVIHDQKEQKLYVFRDRLGVKPLFYYWNGKTFIFASELKSFNSLSHIDKQVNTEALNIFLKIGYIPEPHTIFKQIKKFPSGTYACVTQSGCTFEKYWSITEKTNKNLLTNYGSAKKELRRLLESSVQYRMISDVTFGSFLSGGIDSSLVTAIASNHSNVPFKTFSIGFKDQAFDESKHARKIADFLKTEHNEFIVFEKEAIDHFEKIMDNFDEPYADTSALPTYMVSKMAGQQVKMVLTGDGGDELFMGYGAYQWAERLSSPLYKFLKRPASVLLRNFGNNKYKRISHLLEAPSDGKIRSHIFSQEQYLFTQKEINCMVRQEYRNSVDLNEAYSSGERIFTAAEEQAMFDMEYYLKDDLLVKVDRASMLASVEAREPLLDYRLVEFALNIPQSFKMKNNESKIILKDVLYDYIPKSFFERPKKGFSIPLSAWLKSELAYLIEDYLSKEKIQEVNIFEYTYIQNLLNRFKNGDDYLYNRIFAVISIQKWFIKNKIS